jgi:hypothetical protein
MSPVWLEEWEAHVLAAHLGVIFLELHSVCTSNQGRRYNRGSGVVRQWKIRGEGWAQVRRKRTREVKGRAY